MDGPGKRRWTVFGLVLVAGCSPGRESLLQDGRNALHSLERPSVDTVLVTKGIGSLRSFIERYTSDPRVDSAYYMLASLQGILSKNDEAVASFFQLINAYPHSPLRPNSLILAGHIYEETYKYDQAKACLEKLIREYPDHEFVRNGSAKALIDHMGQPLDEWIIPFEPDSTTSPAAGKRARSSV
jgi:tetratricopeptide (TPR) repeat protein